MKIRETWWPPLAGLLVGFLSLLLMRPPIEVGSIATTAWASGGPAMTCTLSRPIVNAGDAVQVTTWVPAQRLLGAELQWIETTKGKIRGHHPSFTWDLIGVAPGAYRTTVVLKRSGTEVERCSLVVVVGINIEERGAKRLTGRMLLPKGQQEAPGYGLYSYLILPAPPRDAERKKYLTIVEALVRNFPPVLELENYGVSPGDLNLAYIPVTESADTQLDGFLAIRNYRAAADWILSRYDHARAQVLLHKITARQFHDPIIISYNRPLIGALSVDERRLLLHNFARVPVNLSERWVHNFLDRSSQTNWSSHELEDFGLDLIVILTVMAEGVGKAKNAFRDWVVWGAEVKSLLGE